MIDTEADAQLDSSGRTCMSKAQLEKWRAGLCISPYCRRPARHQRRRCCTCRSRLYDKPLRRLYRNLKAHAKARGKQFDLTWDEFAECAHASGYDVHHGRKADCLTVDRKNAKLGYVPGNLQFITASQNAAKSWYDRDPF